MKPLYRLATTFVAVLLPVLFIGAYNPASVPSVPSYAVMKNLPGGIYTRVQRDAYATMGDGGWAEYYWVPSSTCADDGGSCIVPTGGGGTGRWQIMPQASYSVKIWGAACDSVTNDATAIQAGITYAEAIGGGIVTIPALGCKYTSQLSITAGNVVIKGLAPRASTLICATGSSGCISMLGTSTGSQIYGDFITDLILNVSGATGGYALSGRFVAQSGLERVTIENYLNGISLSGFNDFRLRDTTLTTANATNPGSNVGLIVYSQVANERSDLLTLDHFTIEQNFAGAGCMTWNNFVYTVRISGVNLLGCAKGLRINTTGDVTNYPQFLQADDLEIDSATDVALSVEGPMQMLYAVNSQITTTGSVPALELGSSMLDAFLQADRILGGNYGAHVGSGSFHVSFIGDDFNSSTTGEVNDASRKAQVAGGYSHTGLAMGFDSLAYGNATPTISSCGTGASVTGTGTQGKITTGTGTVTSCQLSFVNSFSSQPTCSVTATNSAFKAFITANDAFGLTLGFDVSIPSTFVYYKCSN